MGDIRHSLKSEDKGRTQGISAKYHSSTLVSVDFKLLVPLSIFGMLTPLGKFEVFFYLPAKALRIETKTKTNEAKIEKSRYLT